MIDIGDAIAASAAPGAFHDIQSMGFEGGIEALGGNDEANVGPRALVGSNGFGDGVPSRLLDEADASTDDFTAIEKDKIEGLEVIEDLGGGDEFFIHF